MSGFSLLYEVIFYYIKSDIRKCLIHSSQSFRDPLYLCTSRFTVKMFMKRINVHSLQGLYRLNTEIKGYNNLGYKKMVEWDC